MLYQLNKHKNVFDNRINVKGENTRNMKIYLFLGQLTLPWNTAFRTKPSMTEANRRCRNGNESNKLLTSGLGFSHIGANASLPAASGTTSHTLVVHPAKAKKIILTPLRCQTNQPMAICKSGVIEKSEKEKQRHTGPKGSPSSANTFKTLIYTSCQKIPL